MVKRYLLSTTLSVVDVGLAGGASDSRCCVWSNDDCSCGLTDDIFLYPDSRYTHTHSTLDAVYDIMKSARDVFYHFASSLLLLTRDILFNATTTTIN